MKRSAIFGVTILVLAAAVGVVMAVRHSLRQPASSQRPGSASSTPPNLADWNQFNEPGFGISFKYPYDWEIVTKSTSTKYGVGGSVTFRQVGSTAIFVTPEDKSMEFMVNVDVAYTSDAQWRAEHSQSRSPQWEIESPTETPRHWFQRLASSSTAQRDLEYFVDREISVRGYEGFVISSGGAIGITEYVFFLPGKGVISFVSYGSASSKAIDQLMPQAAGTSTPFIEKLINAVFPTLQIQ